MSGLDILYSVGIVAGIFIVIVLSYFMLNEINTNTTFTSKLDAAGVDRPATIGKAVDAIRLFDYALPFILFSICLLTIIFASLINTNPALFYMFVLIMLVTIFLSAVFSNVVFRVVSEDTLSSAADQFPITMAILGVYPIVGLVILIITAIVAYGGVGRPSGAYG